MNTTRSRERGSALVVTLLVMVLLLLLGSALLTAADIETHIAANDRWAEAAFFAAEAGVETAIDKIGVDQAVSQQAVPVTSIGDGFSFRSGRRTDTTAQPITFVRSSTAAGFALGAGTGYTGAGYVYETYQINATGMGPRDTQREVEVQVEFGPIAR
jgi:Tfp pilus assembly protein PilX